MTDEVEDISKNLGLLTLGKLNPLNTTKQLVAEVMRKGDVVTSKLPFVLTSCHLFPKIC